MGFTTLEPGAEQQAVDRLVSSGIFDRSPGQERLFQYLCRKYFDGDSSQLKEYTVAVEAFGRPEAFEPKDDSIVRVEMFRLRKRLREYYASKGAADPVHIAIPEKSYQLEFLRPNSPMVAAVMEGRGGEKSPSRSHWIWIGLAVVILGAAGTVWRWTANRSDAAARKALSTLPTVARADSSSRNLAAAAEGSEIRILAGRPGLRYIDPFGNVWSGDQHFEGGNATAMEGPSGLRGYDPNILAGYREGTFRYRIPAKPGVYEVMLIFAEPMLSAAQLPGSTEETREFAVNINGRVALRQFDVKDVVGSYYTAHFRAFKDIEPSGGAIQLAFTGRAFVNAIVIRPGIRGRMKPLRIVAQRQPFRDAQGNLWQADHFYQGGRQIVRPVPPTVDDGRLYLGERHGTFEYSIPVPPGSYRVNLYFWESWWGEGRQGEGGPGSRVFDVFCNFRPLMTGFDLLAETRGPNVIKKSFAPLLPDANGQLRLSFVPRANRALINAIEVMDEGAGN